MSDLFYEDDLAAHRAAVKAHALATAALTVLRGCPDGATTATLALWRVSEETLYALAAADVIWPELQCVTHKGNGAPVYYVTRWRIK